MGYSDNITSIQQPSFKQKILFSKLFDGCEELTLKHLKLILQKMFDNADDTLFALAEKTTSTTDSTAYFDSMRIIRLKRAEIESQHSDYIKQAFAELKNHKSTPQEEGKSLDTFSMDELALIEDTDLEENIAIKNIVSKVSHHCSQDLSAIEKRLSHILDIEVTAENNPLGPNVISNTFMKSATALDIDLKISLIILKLFEQAIITGISPLLNETNNLFIAANVLPEFKHTIQKSEHLDNPHDMPTNQQTGSPLEQDHRGYSQAPTAPGYTQSGSAGFIQQNQASMQDTSIGHFSQLLTQQQTQTNPANMQAGNVHPLMSPQAGGVENNGVAGTSTQAGGYTVTTPQFIGSLTQLQNIPHSFTQQTVSTTTNESGEQVEEIQLQSTNNLKEFVVTQLQQQDENFSVNHINPIDQDVIDVVSMLFEFILEDKTIPDVAKAHIARLQIPLLKAAILDKEFFSTNKNAARSLLNELAHAALGIIDESDAASQSLLTEIERIVNIINDDFDDDLSLFDQQLALFNEFIEQHTHQEDNINHRIEKKIKRKEDNALAYHWVEDTIDEILSNKHLPDVIIELINGPWKKVMLNTYLNNGQDSDTWKNQVRFIDVLEWSIQPKNQSIDRQKLANIIGQLVMTLRNGLQVIQVSEAEIKNIILQLEPFHLASIKGLSLKDYLATRTPHEAFLFGETDKKVDAEVIPTDTESNTTSIETNNITTSAESSNLESISDLQSSNIIVEEIEFETDENYETNLSLDEIDQTIIAMEQELRSLETLAESMDQDTLLSDASSTLENEDNHAEIHDEMDDDFALLGDNEALDDDDNFNKLITEDIILAGYSTEQDESPEDQPQDEYLELARHLEQGKWVEFLDDNQNKTRAKLAWKSELLGEYTFLNWKFDVIADKTLYGLAADLRRGSATIIDDLPLVERALSAVMSSLTPSESGSQSSQA